MLKKPKVKSALMSVKSMSEEEEKVEIWNEEQETKIT